MILLSILEFITQSIITSFVSHSTDVATTSYAKIDLGKPIYVETERIIDQKQIGPNRTQLFFGDSKSLTHSRLLSKIYGNELSLPEEEYYKE